MYLLLTRNKCVFPTVLSIIEFQESVHAWGDTTESWQLLTYQVLVKIHDFSENLELNTIYYSNFLEFHFFIATPKKKKLNGKISTTAEIVDKILTN